MMRRLDMNKLLTVVLLVVLIIFLVYLLSGYSPERKAEGKEGQKPEITYVSEDSADKREDEENPGERVNLSEKEIAQQAEKLLEEMSLRDKIYQMFLVRPEQITKVKTVTAAGTTTRNALKTYPVGGIIYSEKNLVSREQIKTVISNSQSYAKIPLFIAVDEEGGTVSRLMSALGTTQVDSMYSYRKEGTDTARKNAETIARDMKKLGFNLNFAPVADVWSNPDNQVIAERAYSDDFAEAAELVGAAVEGFHEQGVLCTLKHFPGHGDTAQDSHSQMAYVTKDLKELEKQEFLPFAAGIKKGADFVMVGHLMVNSLDEEYPASLSEKIIQNLLVEDLGFTGIVITDSLEMKALTDRYDGGEIAVLAVKAGNDMLLEPMDLEEATEAIQEAVEDGEISEERIDRSVRKILEKKLAQGIIK